ncbi:hypothetical protein HZB04_03705, partial [Candidatus Wolfebacteria bacterium]|nr:hypothetical protein [Candidatus Wolfebacteria bacterium]
SSATSCSIDNGVDSGGKTKGSAIARPLKDTTYTLTCQGLDGNRSSSVPVTIKQDFQYKYQEVAP